MMPLLGAVVSPDRTWGAWAGDPAAVLLLVLLGVAYGRGVERVWRQVGRGRVVRGWQVGAFAAGWATLAVALVSPVGALAGTLLSVHMVQHLLLMLIAAPLLVLGAPLLPIVSALPGHLRGLTHGARLPLPWRRRLTSPGAVLVACGAYVGGLWVWHLPVLYEAALRSAAVHALEHLTMLGAAVWVWSTVLQRGGPRRRVSALVAPALFVTAALTVGLAALLTFSPEAWYAHYAQGAAVWGLTPLEDQQRAGAIMWVAGGILTTAAGAVAFGAWMVGDHQRLGDAPLPDVPRSAAVGRGSATPRREL